MVLTRSGSKRQASATGGNSASSAGAPAKDTAATKGSPAKAGKAGKTGKAGSKAGSKTADSETADSQQRQQRQSDLAAVMGTHTAERLQNSRVLMVGAGGIGCELLKNLALSGFGHIEAVDLDTIDLSNLNRQFLFQTQHIKQSKAKVARESALRFNPSARITAHHASIFEDRFDLAWFRSFDLVLNALDNVAARRHVNLMCIAANVPLVESGTAGYHGQVSLHLRNHSACYDCSPKPIERKTYPVCTIRSTPSEPIHCIVWAKNYLYSSLFGNAEDDSDAMTTDATSDNAQELQELKAESAALQQLRDNLGKDQYGQLVFEKVFDKDIRRLLAMDDLWKKTRKPDTLSYAQLQSAMSDFVPSDPSALSFDQSVWDLHHNVHVFLASMNELAKTLLEERKADANYQLSFDKDDEPSLNFVTAAANLRAACFHIGQKSRFEVKQMAGNIIPAIATTNAIVAGMMVMLAFKTLLGQSSACKNTFIQYGGIRNHFLSSESLPAPNPSCSVCSVAYFALRINTANSKLSDVIDRVILGGEFGTGDKTDGLGLKGEITVQRDQALIYDVEFDDNRDSLLSQLSVKDRSRLTITNDVDHDDPDQSAAVPVAVTLFIEHWPDAKAGEFELLGPRTFRPRPSAAAPPPPASAEPAAASGKRAADQIVSIDLDDSDGQAQQASSSGAGAVAGSASSASVAAASDPSVSHAHKRPRVADSVDDDDLVVL